MNLIIKICILFYAIGWVSSGVIVGPETPVYYLENLRSDFIKIRAARQVFEASENYNYYLDQSKRDGTFFFSIVVVVDYHYSNQTLQEIIAPWNKVAELFEKLETPKIRINIAGVVIPKKKIWSSTQKRKLPNGNSIKYYRVPSILETMTTWFLNNAHHFEATSYHMFAYMSKYLFIDPTDTNSNCYYNYIMGPCTCVKKNEPGSAFGGLVWKEHEFTFSAAQLIAIALGIPLDDVSKCGTGHIMAIMDHSANATWSECSKEAFKNFNSPVICTFCIVALSPEALESSCNLWRWIDPKDNWNRFDTCLG
ncbi:hypothetical protein KQX54_019463 [Cotesia glomerata]|uniref:Uncharacterized protein n=1 Tax=Cotesia glomerata TaxID=32391 RepID=A0AAV7J0P2_COTGL|nr:hypothetical protein KQX54_019463 [Cotesia glomerata]